MVITPWLLVAGPIRAAQGREKAQQEWRVLVLVPTRLHKPCPEDQFRSQESAHSATSLLRGLDPQYTAAIAERPSAKSLQVWVV